MNGLKSSFAPVVDARTRLLVLGSLPGEVSLAKAEYYAHPQNQFWRLMERVIERPLAGRPYAERLETLLAAGVGLWDVVGSAMREGSLDARIRLHAAHPLAEFASALPALVAIAFNGGTAFRIGSRELGPQPTLTLVRLPSSSPAYASLTLEDKLRAWLRLRAFVAPQA